MNSKGIEISVYDNRSILFLIPSIHLDLSSGIFAVTFSWIFWSLEIAIKEVADGNP
ncbi:MAG: hypothetical protein A4E60_00981 [Syntrophorhabdus sp. PtaB.Bin047]|nr:MAG: hypothetical protein A4E60_00981 [Syntrophorhabdus sp. PtaB.Bin047]